MFYFKYSPIAKLGRRDDILTLSVQYFYPLPTEAVYKNLNQIERFKMIFWNFIHKIYEDSNKIQTSGLSFDQVVGTMKYQSR